MYYAGSDLKFNVEATFEGFSMEDDDFEIIIKDRWCRPKYIISKEDCFRDSNGGFYFTIENISAGSYYAYFTAYVPDNDYVKQIRKVVKKRLLYVVDSCGCHVSYDDCKCDADCECRKGLDVKYKQFWTVNLDGDIYLVDKDGGYILTSDGQRIKFNER